MTFVVVVVVFVAFLRKLQNYANAKIFQIIIKSLEENNEKKKLKFQIR